MAINRSRRQAIETRLRRFYLEDFPFAKKQLIESREAPGIEIEDPNLWMRYRNALDRVTEVQAMLAKGQLPSNADDPETIVDNASYLIHNTAVESWAQAASFVIGRLTRILDRFDTRGDVSTARDFLTKALKSESTARQRRSVNMGTNDGSIGHYRTAVELATQGIQIVHEASPVERRALRIAIVGVVIGVVGILVSVGMGILAFLV